MDNNKRAQYTLREDVAHFQYGVPGDYKKYDVPATADLRALYEQQVESGETLNSLANTDTQYAQVAVVAPKVVAFEAVLAKTIRVEV